ncbi:biopolymer transport protein ExbB [Sulfitobacter undariae]|uniref:Biopolymer transport protein ExbB n=1 Tax=Sulfitobacter undariae TaxID=1563671 RepID=A0A7W6H314_9RHOB|nr:MotA/TolQ/ExbB proton channel family protein [Sulfitobacter undariae]MBB3995404.1 biopolymer transport protein ExbB [Sulfitobacter undariae]
MLNISQWLEPIRQIAEIGGPVVVILMSVGVLTLAITFYKVWQFWMAGVGRHHALRNAVTAWDAGDRTGARTALDRSTSYLAPVIDSAFSATPQMETRLQADAETRFAKLESGFRFLDSVAQLAPLLGLFGTVLGMIEAFQSLQDAGAQVDPSILAGGIWVALMTTAVGLVVAMPTALILSWLESRVEAERVIADKAIMTVLQPVGASASRETSDGMVPAHG